MVGSSLTSQSSEKLKPFLVSLRFYFSIQQSDSQWGQKCVGGNRLNSALLIGKKLPHRISLTHSEWVNNCKNNPNSNFFKTLSMHVLQRLHKQTTGKIQAHSSPSRSQTMNIPQSLWSTDTDQSSGCSLSFKNQIISLQQNTYHHKTTTKLVSKG